MNEYARTKSLTDSGRCNLVKILVAHMTGEHGYVYASNTEVDKEVFEFLLKKQDIYTPKSDSLPSMVQNNTPLLAKGVI